MTNRSQSAKGELPVIINPDNQSESGMAALLDLVNQNRDRLDEHLTTTGAILFRGYAIDKPEDFFHSVQVADRRAEALSWWRFTPNISTEKYLYVHGIPASQGNILTQRTHLYGLVAKSSRVLVQHCALKTGGQTQIADSRAVYREIDSEVRARFEQKGVLYTRSYHDEGGAGKSWQETFRNRKPG